jgi:hypothetical protein
MSKTWIIVLSIIATVFILIANFALWLQRDIFDQDRFVSTSVSVIRTKPVREAIAAEIVQDAFSSLPALESIIGDFLQTNLSALLDSKAVKPALEDIATQIHTALTAKQPQPVQIDISAVTGPAKAVVNNVPGIDPQIKKAVKSLPNAVVLVKKGDIPSIYSVGTFFLWFGPLAGLIGLGLFVIVIWLAREKRSSAIKTVGASLGIGAAVFLILIQAYRAPVLSSFSGNIRIIFEHLYDAFTAGLSNQTWAIFVIGLVAFLLGYGLDYLAGTRGPKKEQEDFKEAA